LILSCHFVNYFESIAELIKFSRSCLSGSKLRKKLLVPCSYDFKWLLLFFQGFPFFDVGIQNNLSQSFSADLEMEI